MKFEGEIIVLDCEKIRVQRRFPNEPNGISISCGKDDISIACSRYKLKELLTRGSEFLKEDGGEKQATLSVEEIFETIRQRANDQSHFVEYRNRDEVMLKLSDIEDILDEMEEVYDESKRK